MKRAGPRFMAVALDVDSTLCGMEGIDWLATHRGKDVSSRVAELTGRAMRGEVQLEDVYGKRLSMVRPRREDVEALGLAYMDTIAPGAVEAVAAWRSVGVRVILLSSAIRQSILRVARHIGLGAGDVHAVDVAFDAAGAWSGYDRSSPLTTAVGKRSIVASLDLPRPILAVGDGSTDLAIRGAAGAAFAAFCGFVTRPEITGKADFVVSSFDELTPIILGAT